MQAPGYQVKYESITGTGASLCLRSLLDRQQYHDPLGEAEQAGISAAHWPLFGLLWPSGRVLAQAMLTFELEGLRVLEMGCGLGLASLVVHRRGGNVTASDCHPLAAPFLRENLRLNELPPMKYETGHWTRPNPGLGLFDLIIGSDVLYERGHAEQLASLVLRHTRPEAEVLITDPGRGNSGAFTTAMRGQGYAVDEVRSAFDDGDAEPFRGRLLSYRR